MKKILITLGILLIGTIVVCSDCQINKEIPLGRIGYGTDIYTTKVTTPEGTYRLFISEYWKGGGITAVKIK